MVEAVAAHDTKRLERFYHDCRSYFMQHAGALFVSEALAGDIFQEALIHLWREIETHRIEVVDEVVCRWTEGEPRPMTSSLFTFLMAIAKRKHWEQLRRGQDLLLTDEIEVFDRGRYDTQPVGTENEAEMRERIVSDAVLAMSDRCRQILTMFYYEQRSLDEILQLRPENSSKVGLKTSKYKCMQRLRETVKSKFIQMGLHI